MSADIARAIQKEAESDPPLSARQWGRLAVLLRADKKNQLSRTGEEQGS
jgi:hypothetical protein